MKVRKGDFMGGQRSPLKDMVPVFAIPPLRMDKETKKHKLKPLLGLKSSVAQKVYLGQM